MVTDLNGSTQSYVDSSPTLVITSAYTYTKVSSLCPLTAKLSIQETGQAMTDYDAATHPWVSSFLTANTGSNLDAGLLNIEISGAVAMTPFKPHTTFKIRIDI